MEHDGREATLKWVSGHAGIEGNEDADRLAGAAARLSSPLNCTVTIAAGSRWARETAEKDFRQ
jgi:ribonuclease HI